MELHDEKQVLQDITAAVKAAVEAMPTPLNMDEIVRDAMKVLRSERTNAVWALLGLENKWGKWEIDHCNGRESPVSRWVNSEGVAPIKAFMDEHLGDILEKKKEEFRKQIRPNIAKQLDGHMRAAMELGYQTRREFESVLLEEIKAAVQERRTEIRSAVLQNMNIDPENYRVKKERW